MNCLSLIPDLLSESSAANTVRKYYYGFRRWKAWAQSVNIPDGDILPAKPFHVALYIASLSQTSNTCSPIIDAVYSIKWAHSIIGIISPTDSDIDKNIFEGAKRRIGSSVTKKEPITPELLNLMYNKYFAVRNVYYQRTICACLLSYSGFLRTSELLNLRRSDIQFFNSHICVSSRKVKPIYTEIVVS